MYFKSLMFFLECFQLGIYFIFKSDGVKGKTESKRNKEGNNDVQQKLKVTLRNPTMKCFVKLVTVFLRLIEQKRKQKLNLNQKIKLKNVESKKK